MRRPFYTLLLAAFAMTRCKKESVMVAPAPGDLIPTELARGLPEKPGSLHGYFYSGYNYQLHSPYSPKVITTCYAQFSDPPLNLLSSIDRKNQGEASVTRPLTNVGMGNVRYNSFTLYSSQNTAPFYYFLQNYYDKPAVNQRVFWQVDGNEVIAPFEVRMWGKFPLPKDTFSQFVIYPTKGFTLQTSHFFEDFDSLAVQITGEMSNQNTYSIHKDGDATCTEIIFEPKQLGFYKTGSNNILTVRAFRYFNRSIAGRRYVFEVSTGVEYKVSVIR